MSLIIDPDNLTRSEVVIDTSAKTIGLTIGGQLSTDGVTLKCLYSFLKEEWKTDADLIKFAFPMQPITDESFEFINSWNFLNNASRYLVRTGGWAVKDANGVSTSEWTGIVTLGNLGALDQVYYQDKNGGSATNIQLSGVVNQAINVYDTTNAKQVLSASKIASGLATIYTNTPHALCANDWTVVSNLTGTGYNGTWQVNTVPTANRFTFYSTNSSVDAIYKESLAGISTQDYRHYFKIFTREYEKTYAVASLADIGVNAGMTYQVYRFPLTNATDLNIVDTDTQVDSPTSVYADMAITWYTGAQEISGFTGGNGNFHVIIDGAAGAATTQEIYTFVQRQLRKNSDIDSGVDVVIGKTANELLQFVGSTLKTKLYDTAQGTYISGFNVTDTNDLRFVDDLNAERQYPFVAALSLQFGANLVADSSSIYRVFFTNDSAATIPSGYNFGTANAILVKDNDGVDMSGTINGTTPIAKTFAYDSNVQRGAGSAGQDAPITVVAIGLDTAQYVIATGSIARSSSNSVSLVAPLERNYSNP